MLWLILRPNGGFAPTTSYFSFIELKYFSSTIESPNETFFKHESIPKASILNDIVL